MTSHGHDLQRLSSQCFGKPSTTKEDARTGDRDAALQLAAKGKEHAQLAKEARQAANQAAFESFNLHVTNRFKVGPINRPLDCRRHLLSMYSKVFAQICL